MSETQDKYIQVPRQTTVEALSDSAAKRKTAADSLQEPTTLLPLALFAASGVYLVLLAPILGGVAVALTITLVSGTAATASYVGHYRRIYPIHSVAMMEAKDDERVRLEDADLERFCEVLRTGFIAAASAEGLRILRALNVRYGQLRPAIDRRRASDPLSVSLIPALAGETYRQGLSVLSDALELMAVIRLPGTGILEEHMAEPGRMPNRSDDQRYRVEKNRLREERLASDMDRLDTMARLELHIEQLLHQAHRCEAALESAQMELASARAGGSRTSADSVIEALQGTIRRVKEVQAELDKLRH